TNSAAEKLLQYEKGELQGGDFFSFVREGEDLRKRLLAGHVGETPGEGLTVAAELDLRDGRFYCADITFTRLDPRKNIFLARVRKCGTSGGDPLA
ncbi:MAG TPA: PAS domain-containing protein, partial [Verrucomicrobiae bacterium]|nr:PAS domain-containing protein [Verrucomicrobiae bacterium]